MKPISIKPHERYDQMWYVVYDDGETGGMFYNKTRALDILRYYDMYIQQEDQLTNAPFQRRSSLTGRFI